MNDPTTMGHEIRGSEALALPRVQETISKFSDLESSFAHLRKQLQDILNRVEGERGEKDGAQPLNEDPGKRLGYLGQLDIIHDKLITELDDLRRITERLGQQF